MSDWKADVTTAVETFTDALEPGATFSANDLWKTGLPEMEDNRWLNSVLIGMEKAGRIAATGAKVRSTRGHGNPIRVWERVY